MQRPGDSGPYRAAIMLSITPSGRAAATTPNPPSRSASWRASARTMPQGSIVPNLSRTTTSATPSVISKTSVMGKGFVTLKINEVDPFRRYQSSSWLNASCSTFSHLWSLPVCNLVNLGELPERKMGRKSIRTRSGAHGVSRLRFKCIPDRRPTSRPATTVQDIQNWLFWTSNSFIFSKGIFSPGGGLQGGHDPVQNDCEATFYGKCLN